MRTNRKFFRICVVGVVCVLVGCGGGRTPETTSPPSQSAGQVAPQSSTSSVGFYAASRFAEQASFGPTPTLIAEIRQKGFEVWIDEQLAMPPTLVDETPLLGFADPIPQQDWRTYHAIFPNVTVAAPDQLRSRVVWSLSQFIVASDRKIDIVGMVYWKKLLQQRSLGTYSDLLYHVSLSPAMAAYLDNDQNRPKSDACPHCAPNENYARELMQLFSLGVFKLNPDGTPVRNPSGGFVETYSQRDVEQLAGVLTGWNHSNDPPNRPGRNWGNWGKPMIPSIWPPDRDSREKTVLGRIFPAGQSHDQDLRDAIAMLMAHPNIAPFVATRLIQHLVKSNPTPAYVGRVAAKFRNNGQGVVGDMKAVVKAILLDPEARAGDVPGAGRADDGKFREPFLHHAALWRALGCARVPSYSLWGPAIPQNQRPFSADSVFSYYAPTDRAPGSNLLAPEQKLANASEFTHRLWLAHSLTWDDSTQQRNLTAYSQAGCSVEPLITAYTTSPRAFNDYISARFFRGAMPPTLRSNIELLIKEPQWDTRNPIEGAMRLLDFALSTPYFGVMK